MTTSYSFFIERVTVTTERTSVSIDSETYAMHFAEREFSEGRGDASTVVTTTIKRVSRGQAQDHGPVQSASAGDSGR